MEKDGTRFNSKKDIELFRDKFCYNCLNSRLEESCDVEKRLLSYKLGDIEAFPGEYLLPIDKDYKYLCDKYSTDDVDLMNDFIQLKKSI